MVSEKCQFITYALVIAGWFFVDWRNNKRELRKEKRSLIDRTHVDINSIESKAVEYHQGAHNNEQLSKEIKILLDRLIKVITREKLISNNNFRKYSDFKRAITLNNFDSSSYICQPDNSELLDKIYSTKDNLVHEIEMKFSNDFR
ncbi:hypothetical protein [Crenothrix polyspora]|uniref:Uncharacterized protein n=1 Tax=Crenothrix polyspora TaxID=360316 RepID=A0A1R4H8G9_9GAMM|nr:hypothetical protein [Crenothrix polyspora]SJM92555.1 hypothetical protein CRENPOLYSF1_300021 [Crenothrix polyspora]